MNYSKMSNPEYLRLVGHKIFWAAKFKGISIYEIEKKMNLWCPLPLITSGKEVLTYSEMEKLADILDVSLEWLLEPKIDGDYLLNKNKQN